MLNPNSLSPNIAMVGRRQSAIARGAIAALVASLVTAGTPALVVAQATTINQGYAQLSQGQVDAAIATFQRLVQQNPNQVEAQLGLGIAYRRAGRDA
jgi:cellulose synthase operon protein C